MRETDPGAAPGPSAMLAVTDTGCGIPAAFQAGHVEQGSVLVQKPVSADDLLLVVAEAIRGVEQVA